MTTAGSDSDIPRSDSYEPSEQVDLEIEILASEMAAREEEESEETSPETDQAPEGPLAP